MKRRGFFKQLGALAASVALSQYLLAVPDQYVISDEARWRKFRQDLVTSVIF